MHKLILPNMQPKKGGPPDMKKYERMKKIGMPLDSIINRMRMDGVSKDIIDEWGGNTQKKKANQIGIYFHNIYVINRYIAYIYNIIII